MSEGNNKSINTKLGANKSSINPYTENILIVDDEIRHLNSLKELIKGEKYNVTLANSADEAISALDARNIDLLLLDLNMPGKGGVEVMKHIDNHKIDTH